MNVPSVEEVKAAAPAAPVYEQDEIVCTLTLDQKQAWVLLTLLAPYKTAEPDNWDIYRAAWHVRLRLAEAMGYE